MAKRLSRGQIWQIFKLIRPYWGVIFGLSGLILVMALVNQVSPLLNRALIDLLTGKITYLGRISLGFASLIGLVLFVRAVQTIINRITTHISRLLGMRLQFHLRGLAFQHLLNLSISYYSRNQSGKVMSRVSRGADSVRSIISNVGVHVLPSAVTALIAIEVVVS
ncbi:MAG: ABC transporter related protein, partial [Candidatus Gottesmanbacteria bacterium GW2011_GWA1_47_8]